MSNALTDILPAGATVLNWLDKHSGSVTALSTVVLAGITALYVVVTYSLVREQRRQRSRPSVAYELDSAPEGLELKVRNLGNGRATNLALIAGPRVSLPHGIEIDSLGPGFNLGPSEEKTWLIRSRRDIGDIDIPLTLTYMDHDHEVVWISCFLIRCRGAVAHTSASFDDQITMRWLKAAARKSVSLRRRLRLMWEQRSLQLEPALVDGIIRKALAAHLHEGLQKALKWEQDFDASLGEI